MRTATKKAKTTAKPKFDIYETLTQELVEMMEAGICPWKKPWHSIGGIPRNYKGRAYRGANAVFLAMKCMAKAWENPIFLTFKQVEECKGSVLKGENSTMVTFASIMVPKEYKGRESECPQSEKRFTMRYYRVFNIDQCEGVALPKHAKTEFEELDFSPIEACESILENMPKRPTMKTGVAAYYRPTTDTVVLPKKEAFTSEEGFYNVAFHELSHSTGHESRLNRVEAFENGFGSDPYAFEELVAELSATFICGHAGIVTETKETSAAYLQSWLKVFKNDTKFFFRAAAMAQKSADFILGTTFDNQD